MSDFILKLAHFAETAVLLQLRCACMRFLQRPFDSNRP
jgi:hypothetical protein